MTFFTRYLYFWVRLKFLTMIIDSHVHFWEYDKKRQEWIGSGMKILQQDYLPQHLLPTLRRNGVDACIAVQSHPSELETRFISELAATHPFIKGVIGWIDLQADNIDAKLAEFAQYPAIKGYRYNFTETSNDALLEDHFAKAIQALQPYSYTFDLLLKPTQLTAAANLLTQFPDQTFILDHCGKPDIKNKKMDEWKVGMEALSRLPNLYCKLSGLFTEAKWKEWSASEFYPYLDYVFDKFGPSRLLYGSDWPQLLLSGIYVQWKSLLEKYMENFDNDTRAMVFGENAAGVYNLNG